MALTGNHHYGVHDTILTVSPDCSLQGFRLICADCSPSDVDVQIHRSSYPQLHNLAMKCSMLPGGVFLSHSPHLPTPAFPHVPPFLLPLPSQSSVAFQIALCILSPLMLQPHMLMLTCSIVFAILHSVLLVLNSCMRVYAA